MPYYIAPYIGSGVARDPFRPRGSDQPGWSAIDLRPDPSRQDGGGLSACFLFLPVANADPQLTLVALNKVDTIGAGLRNTITNRLNLLQPPTSTTWADLAMELLLGPPPGGWKPLLLSGSVYDVYLGGLLKRIVVKLQGGSYAENWNCADNASLNCQQTWTEEADVYSISSNKARVTATTGYAWARAEVDLGVVNHYAEVTIVDLVSVDFTEGGPIIRKDSTNTDTFYTLLASHSTSFGINEHILFKFVGGANTALGSADTTDFAAGETLKIQAVGSTITTSRNGLALSMSPQTDTSITSGVRAGILANVDTATGSGMFVEYDSFSAWEITGNIGTGQPYPFPRMPHRLTDRTASLPVVL